jgi:membrane associated rhomboid family serine protease
VTPWVLRLLIANVVIFFVQQTSPGLTQTLWFYPPQMLLKPWTLVTYMFLHGGFGHIFFNMITLAFIGPMVEERLGARRFLTLYVVSGIAGALLSSVLARGVPIVGASAAIYGVLLALARFWPRLRLMIYGVIPVEARWLVLIYAAIDLVSGIGGQRLGVANFAHLGGLVGGALYLLFLERGRGAGARRFKAAATPQVPDPALGNWRNVDRNSIHAVNREEVDRILDKISASGIGSLTPQERQFLSNFVPPDDRKPM